MKDIKKLMVQKQGKGVFLTDEGHFVYMDDEPEFGTLQHEVEGYTYTIYGIERDDKENVICFYVA